MKIHTTEIGTINDDFINHWKTIRVTQKDGSELLFKYDMMRDEFFTFFFDSDTSETHLKPVSKETAMILEDEMDNPKTIRH